MIGRDVAFVLIAMACTACAHVPAYDRARLAHETLRAEYASSPAVSHVHTVQEGATGGDVGASSGCGCN